MSPPRSQDPRRKDDEVLRALASEALNRWLGAVSKKVVLWFLLVGAGLIAGPTWAASAWAANTTKSVEEVNRRVDSVELVQQAQIAALRDQTEEMRKLRWALDSLRITLQAKR